MAEQSPLVLPRERGSFSTPAGVSENVGPALPDFQQTLKSAFRDEIPTPKVKSLHILNAMQAK